MAHVDLGSIIKSSDVTVAPAEHAEERTARIANEKRAKLLDDIKGMILFSVVLLGVLAIAALCTHTIFFNTTATAETQKWTQTMLTALVSGGLSFLLGRAISSK